MSQRDTYIQRIRRLPITHMDQGEVRWQSPSNIALVKYWGKLGDQIPMNPSLSFTLQQCHTDTIIRFTHRAGVYTSPEISFRFEGSLRPSFEKRMTTYLQSIQDLCPFLTHYKLEIESVNSFPFGAGIASSASAYSALALCLTSIEDLLYQDLEDDDLYRSKTSFLARLGSGSACRSIYAEAAWWGSSEDLAGSSDDYAIGLSDVLHDAYLDMHDAIVIVSSDEKSVSSSRGHELMSAHPYRENRVRQATTHARHMLSALQTGDLDAFGSILEREALAIHGLMISSYPGYFLLNGQTITLIDSLRAFREDTKVPVYFTLDAGPNLHILYPSSVASEVSEWLENLDPQMVDEIIYDRVGPGPIQLI